ncbi:MAG: hypothetical protein KGJ07_00970 [Patescibacteria group bacterium]|nr:hypothetical protein [Patescibacteria group bacterium]MDE2589819.1 hypothetical protein [Patescibacteria group bacterium]
MKIQIKQKIAKAIRSFKKMPLHKSHIDFIAAILAIPMMVTVITLNLFNLQNKAQVNKPTPVPTPIIIQVDSKTNTQPPIPTTVYQPTPVPTSSAACSPGIGQISISYPQEGQTVSANPVCITIDYNGAGYCSVAWAYKINNGDWSDYTNTNVCLYNLPTGNNTFTLDVKSTVGASSQTIIRHFQYNPIGTTPTLTPTTMPTTPTP